MQEAVNQQRSGSVESSREGCTAIAGMSGLKCQITVSLGVTELGEQILEADALLSLADQALYQAKRKGRNRVCIYHD